MNMAILGIGVTWQQWIGVGLSISGAAIVGLSKQN
jgi:drug/metabolite transporter (DMT)-like permease